MYVCIYCNISLSRTCTLNANIDIHTCIFLTSDLQYAMVCTFIFFQAVRSASSSSEFDAYYDSFNVELCRLQALVVPSG